MTRYVPPGSKKTPGPVIKVKGVLCLSFFFAGEGIFILDSEAWRECLDLLVPPAVVNGHSLRWVLMYKPRITFNAKHLQCKFQTLFPDGPGNFKGLHLPLKACLQHGHEQTISCKMRDTRDQENSLYLGMAYRLFLAAIWYSCSSRYPIYRFPLPEIEESNVW